MTRTLWLAIRRRIVPYCMERGCWERSHVLTPKGRPAHRGNLCAVHLWKRVTRIAFGGRHGC